MQDREKLIALKRVNNFLQGIGNDDRKSKDVFIALGLCFVHLDKQEQDIVESTDSMSGFSVDSKADSAEVEDEEVDCSVAYDAGDGSVTRKRKFQIEEGESQQGGSP